MSIFIHESAEVSEKSSIGDGTKVWNLAQIREGAVIGKSCIISKNVYIDKDVRIGDRVKIQNNVNIYHGVVVGNDVFLGPSMTFTNDMFPRAFSDDWEVSETMVEDGASIGANATIVCGTSIGKYAMVGAGSVVTDDVGEYELVAGNPAKRIGWVCRCGGRLRESLVCERCGREYRLNHDRVEAKDA